MQVAHQHVEHVAALFEPGDLIEIRAIRPGQDGRNATERDYVRASDFATPGVAKLLDRLRNQQYNVYVGANPRLRAGGKSSDVAFARCLFADFDNTTPEQAAQAAANAGLPEPTLIVATGHGAHLYWRLSEPIRDLDEWSRWQRGIIEAVESDPAIHDAPRIMRLAGTANFKEDPVQECRIVGGSRAAVTLARIGDAIAPSGAVLRVPVSKPGHDPEWRKKLGRKTLDFLVNGAGEGERNRRLFAAACDAHGCGATLGEALAAFSPIAEASGLPDHEIEGAIRSAFNAPRSPSVLSNEDALAAINGVDSVAASPTQAQEPVTKAKPPQGREIEPEAKQPRPAQAARPSVEPIGPRRLVSNVIAMPAKPGEDKPSFRIVPVEEMAVHLGEASGGWPRRVSGMIFAARTQRESDLRSNPLPGMAAVWMIDSPDALGAWMQSVASVRWYGKAAGVRDGAGNSVTPATKGEFFEYLCNAAEPSYRAISPLPHHPPMAGVYYTPARLPEATGKALDELLSRLNAETEVDRCLMLASIMTPAWGGPPGRRPPFVYTSANGRGVGKTATVDAIAIGIWGGSVTIKPDEPFDKVIGRLLGNDGLGTRCVVLDNVKGRLEGQSIEALVTSRTIDGWRPHYGQFSRPNDLTYFLTANTARLSKDLADRSVVVRLGTQKHDQSFVAWASRFIEENRAQLIADILARLAGPAAGTISRENRDRWQDWQDAVLCRACLEGISPDDLAATIIERRASVDDDAEDGLRVAEAIREYLERQPGRGKTAGVDRVAIGRDELRTLLIEAGCCDERLGVKGVTRWVDQLIGSNGPLRALRDNPSHAKKRSWVWTWSDDLGGGEPGAEGEEVGDIPI